MHHFVPVAAGASPIGDIPTAGSVVDPHSMRIRIQHVRSIAFGSSSGFGSGSRPSWRTSRLREKSSTLKREHLALQNMEFLDFFVGHFCPPVPRPGSSRPKSNQIQADPDPYHWLPVSPNWCWRSYILLVILLRFLHFTCCVSDVLLLVDSWWCRDPCYCRASSAILVLLPLSMRFQNSAYTYRTDNWSSII